MTQATLDNIVPCPKCHNKMPRYALGYYKAYGFYIRCTACGKSVFSDESLNVVRKELARLNGAKS